MKWVKQYGQDVIALQSEDIERAAPLFREAEKLWERDATEFDRHRGTAVLGAGIGVLYLPARCRKARELLVIPSPFQSDGGGSVRTPLNFLARNGIAAFHIYGRTD